MPQSSKKISKEIEEEQGKIKGEYKLKIADKYSGGCLGQVSSLNEYLVRQSDARKFINKEALDKVLNDAKKTALSRFTETVKEKSASTSSLMSIRAMKEEYKV